MKLDDYLRLKVTDEYVLEDLQEYKIFMPSVTNDSPVLYTYCTADKNKIQNFRRNLKNKFDWIANEYDLEKEKFLNFVINLEKELSDIDNNPRNNNTTAKIPGDFEDYLPFQSISPKQKIFLYELKGPTIAELCDESIPIEDKVKYDEMYMVIKARDRITGKLKSVKFPLNNELLDKLLDFYQVNEKPKKNQGRNKDIVVKTRDHLAGRCNLFLKEESSIKTLKEKAYFCGLVYSLIMFDDFIKLDNELDIEDEKEKCLNLFVRPLTYNN